MICAGAYPYQVVDADDGHSLGRFPNLELAAQALARLGARNDPVVLFNGEPVDLDELAAALD